MDDFLLLDGVDFLLLDGSGDRLILGTSPTPPVPPPPPTGGGIGGGGGRGARGRHTESTARGPRTIRDTSRRTPSKSVRQTPPQQIIIRDDDEILAVIQRFLDKIDP